MNKQLIITYFEEFRHWLDGGKLLAKHSNKGWIDYYGEDIWTHSTETLIVIDDEYSIFRKALIEGKIIEVFQKTTERWIKIDTIITSIIPVLYRIKPEEPKFKVGDWVIHNGVAKRVTKAVDGYIDSLDNEVAVIMKEESLELWEPKEGEWCIMHDIDEDPDADSVTLQRWNDKCKWKPIPFIGKLPTYIKDSDES